MREREKEESIRKTERKDRHEEMKTVKKVREKARMVNEREREREDVYQKERGKEKRDVK